MNRTSTAITRVSTTSSSDPVGRNPAWPELVLAGALASAAVVVVLAAREVLVPPTVTAVGPRFVPYLVGALLAAVAVALSVDVLRGGRARTEEGEPVQPVDLRTTGLLVVVLIAHIALIDAAGWVVAASLLFSGSALVLGARRPVPLVAVSVVLPLLTYMAFTEGLGVALPAGPFGW
ncbi:MAG: tripartite tricarboxylate transporter TctB family protein [Dermatophilaceae bacterium]